MIVDHIVKNLRGVWQADGSGSLIHGVEHCRVECLMDQQVNALSKLLYIGRFVGIKKYNNYVRIKNISIGDYLDYDNRVIGIVKICSKFNTVFKYKNKWIFSNNIKINENGIWINIIDSIYSRKISNYIDTLYHLVVTKEKIILENNLIIADYVGVHNNITNNIIDKTVENYLNLKI